jgi:hypothetical protein
MDSLNVLRYDRWKKMNDSTIQRNSFDTSKMDNRVAMSLKPILNKDGFLRQKIVGAANPNLFNGGANQTKPDYKKITIFVSD